MTEQQQAACAELAQRMGWTLESDGHWQAWRSPDGGTRRNVRPSHDEFPVGNFFTDPVASRELAAWLAKQKGFEVERFNNLIADKVRDYGFPATPLQVLTADLPVIARAACKALGIETE